MHQVWEAQVGASRGSQPTTPPPPLASSQPVVLTIATQPTQG